MSVYVALYRGINVGGKRSVKMEALRAMHERLGHRRVTSYIQSGNLVFSATGAADTLSRRTTDAFAREFGFPALLMVVEAKRWNAFVTSNPYSKFAAENPKTVHLGICDGDPDVTAIKKLFATCGGTESFEAGKEIIYLHSPDGFGTSKFAAGIEKACAVPVTFRNWRTIEALTSLANTDE